MRVKVSVRLDRKGDNDEQLLGLRGKVLRATVTEDPTVPPTFESVFDYGHDWAWVSAPMIALEVPTDWAHRCAKSPARVWDDARTMMALEQSLATSVPKTTEAERAILVLTSTLGIDGACLALGTLSDRTKQEAASVLKKLQGIKGDE